MAVSAIRIKNFMSFADSGWITIAPITLLFGQNSSGKSSILKALMFLKQSADAANVIFTSEYGIDLGSYLNIVHGVKKKPYVNSKKQLSFSFKASINTHALKSAGIDSNEAALDIDLGWNHRKNALDITSFKITILSSNIIDDDLYFKVEIQDYTNGEENPDLFYDTNLIGADSIITKTNIWQRVKLKSVFGFMPFLDLLEDSTPIEPNERPRDWEFVNGILAGLRDDIRKLLRGLAYVKPIRPNPDRLFVINDIKQEELRRQGYSSFIRFLNQGYTNPDQEESLNYWVEHLALGKKIQVKKYTTVPGTSIISEILITNPSGHQLNLADVGFGVSQVLPVLIECLFSESNSTILIQQPELHLHPAAQAELGSMFISSIDSGNKTFIIETHSEHLILRLQREIRNKRFSKKNISVNYIDKKDEKSSCTHLRMNDDGHFIDEWPNGFFDEGFNEIFGE